MTNKESNTDGVMPKPTFDSRVQSISIAELLCSLNEYTEDDLRDRYPWASNFVCGMPLAEWQRPVVWDTEKQQKFIDSIWRGVDLGSYMVNAWWHVVDNKGSTAPLSDIVLDGQQRLTSIENYVSNKFACQAADGNMLYYKDLPKVDITRFKSTRFARASVHSDNEMLLREAYDLRNFTGVAHTDDQRALPRIKP